MKTIRFLFTTLVLTGVIASYAKKDVIAATMEGKTVSVSWSPVTNATGYKVEYKKATDAEFVVAGSPTHSPFSVTEFDFGNVYEFRAKATAAANIHAEYAVPNAE